MATYYRPCIVYGAGTELWLPIPIMSWTETPHGEYEVVDIPRVDGRSVLSGKKGSVNIDIQGRLQALTTAAGKYSYAGGYSPSQGLAIKDLFNAVYGNTFYLYRWHNRRWADCILERAEFRYTDRPFRVIEYSLSIVAHTPTEETAPASIFLTTASPWEDMAGSVPVGDPITMPPDDYQTVNVVFPGIIAEDRQVVIRVLGPASSTLYVAGIGIAGCSGVTPGASGTTTINASKTSLGAAGIDVSVTEAQADNHDTGTITLSTDSDGVSDPVYIYASAAAGGHADLQVYLNITTAS